MAKITQKLVLSLDAENHTYRPADHNFSPEQAVEQNQRLQGEGTSAVIVDQERHHRSLSFHQCKPCKKAAEEATNRQRQASGQQQPEHGTVLSEDEKEND